MFCAVCNMVVWMLTSRNRFLGLGFCSSSLLFIYFLIFQGPPRPGPGRILAQNETSKDGLQDPALTCFIKKLSRAP